MTLTKKKELKKPTKVKSLPKKELSLSKEQQKKLGDIFDKLPKSKQMKMFPELPLKMQTKMFPTLPPEIQTKLLPSLPNLVQTKMFPTLPPEIQTKLLPSLPPTILFQDQIIEKYPSFIDKKQDDLLENINHVTNTINVFYGARDFVIKHND